MRPLVLLCLLFFSIQGAAQRDSIENLVFEGAGIRGIAYSGAITALENRKLLPGIKRVGGTSAGAITAMLLALGYRAAEITAIIGSTRFKSFNSGRFSIPGGINRLQQYFGWYRGKRVEAWLTRLIKAKTGDAGITFARLKVAGFKDLYITGTSLNRQQVVVFSGELFPNMKIKDAVRISMSIPLYFEAVFINSSGSVVNHPKDKTNLDVMVDGGFTANFPIRLFDSSAAPGTPDSIGYSANKKTFGFRIDNDQQIKNDQEGTGLAPMPVTNIREYATAFYNIIIENLNRQTLTVQDWKRTVSISDGSIGPRIRKLSPAEINTLISNGYRATERYLTRKMSNE